LPPTSRENINAIRQENTKSKLQTAITEQDDELDKMADVIASVPDRTISRSSKSQV
jgi:hypothetical protein